MDWTVVAVVVVAYLIGSVDFAVVVARTRGVDIYQVGSGNPGTANVARSLGWGAAAQVLVGDFIKGVAAAALGLWAAGATFDPQAGPVFWTGEVEVAFAAGLAAVIGHCFPLWHRFRGGKGVATGGGAVLLLAPLASVVLMAVWGLLARVFRISSVASLTVVLLSVPALAVIGYRGWALVWAAVMTLLIIVRHRSNIERLIRGSEGGLAPPGEGTASAAHSE